MGKIYKLPKDEMRGELYQRIHLLIRKHPWTWQSVGAVVGIAGGMLSIVLGLLLWAMVSFLMPGALSSSLHLLEIICFALILPLLALGVYCLDLLEKMPPAVPLVPEPQPTDFDRWPRVRPRRPHNN